jgi:H/ACA ribonucleoprotein complex subunit 4
MNKQVFIKKEAIGEFGKTVAERTTEELLEYGIVNIDKPKGPTSHQVSAYVKEILDVNKAGHSGTLDPAVTGVQPIAIGRATRITLFLLTAPKEYVGIMQLHKDIDETTIKKIAKEIFTGKIRQLPPVKSAVKREERTREIYEFEIMEVKGREVLFRIKCQAGTYIRKVCSEFGKQHGFGAHMASLRRTQAGPFREADNLITLNDLKDAMHYYKEENNDKYIRHCIQPIENAITHLAKCWIFDTTIESVTHGRDIGIPGISKLENFKKGELIAIMSLKGELVAIGEALMSGVEINSSEKGLAIKTKKVFIEV